MTLKRDNMNNRTLFEVCKSELKGARPPGQDSPRSRSRTVSSQIRKQLDTVISPKSKLTKPIKKPKATWVEPTFVADVEYRDITSEGLLRASSFEGLSRK